ncbi:hypothetical protein E3N88_21917 [Mikania micrantha]|uniref:Glutamate receptor n=1 Tax=Mikania micrantha TaxID=192012 RepID=A0A5N6N8X4_9ASTR|nr:hypothetical protein E3N88_21917 [Mikania micrantha]
MEIPVGVILDMGSRVGQTIMSCISIAVSEFYAVNSHYKTRIVLHSRDTHGEPMHAVSATLDLMEKLKVQAILGSQSEAEAKLMALLGDQATTPILSFSPIPSSRKHPYFLQITQDETTQVQAIASMALSYGWKNVIVIFEDTENGRDMATFITNFLQEKRIIVTYMHPISASASNEVLQEELHKLSNMKTKLYILHASHSLAFHIFNNAKCLGMMDAGYKWIVTSKTMDLLDFMDDEAMEFMQGVVGLKSYVPQSSDLKKLTLKYHVMELKDINVYAISAYDGVSALAMAVEKTQSALNYNTQDLATTGSAQWGPSLLNEMLRVSFDGLAGNFKFMNAKVVNQILEIINVIGKQEVKVGFWTIDTGFTKMIDKVNSFPHYGLESIAWPGGILNNPTHRMLQVTSRRLRIGIPVKSRSGYLFQVNYSTQTNSTSVSGFCLDVFLTAFQAFDPNVAFDFIPFKHDEDGPVNYNDFIYQVSLGEFDAAIGDITITSNRSLYVDFTLPYTDLGLATLTRNADASMWIFMKPLSSDLWIVSGCFFILVGFVIWILEHGTNDDFQGSLVQQIGTILWFAFSTLVYAHRQKLENNLSRFVVTVWLFVVLVLVSSYTATLSSLLTVEQIQVASLASNKGLIGYQRGTPIQGVIVRNMNFKDSRLKPYNSLEEFADALTKGSKKGGVDAIVDEIPYIKEFLTNYSSGYSMVVSEDSTNGFGFMCIVFVEGGNGDVGVSLFKGVTIGEGVASNMAPLTFAKEGAIGSTGGRVGKQSWCV